MRVEPDCSGRCACSQTASSSAIARMTGSAEVLGVRAREADALDPLDGVHGAQQVGEVSAEVAAVRVHVLAEQGDLLDALAGEALHLGQDLARPAADLAAAHPWDDAVRAHGVAAHQDLHPRLEAALAV